MLTLSSVVPNPHPLSIITSESHGLLLSLPQRLTQDAARRAAAHTLAQSAGPQTSALSFYGNGTKCHIRYYTLFSFSRKKKLDAKLGSKANKSTTITIVKKNNPDKKQQIY